MSLSVRGKDIVILLLKNPSGYPLTLSAISQQLQVSTRTISREIPEIKKWMSKRGYFFRAQSGTGLLIEEPLERKQEILQELTGKSIELSNAREKSLKEQLIEMLLYSEEPIKMTYLCYFYKISEGTLNKELAEVEKWLSRYDVKLIRRSGSGIFISYEEKGYRLAVEALITEYYNASELLSLLYEKTFKKLENIPPFIVKEEAQFIGEILMEAEKRMDVHFTDNSYLGLFVIIALSIYRVRKGKEIQLTEEKISSLQMLPEYSVAEFVSDNIKSNFNVSLSVAEKAFLTMPFAGSRIWKKSFIDQTDVDRLDILHLVVSMIKVMENELNISLGKEENLVQGLCNHLQATCNRLRLGTPIVHPQLGEIKSVYMDLFSATKKACAILEKELNIPLVSDDEVAYIAMHFGAVIEERKVQTEQINAVVVCPTGIGTSRILATKLRRLFPEIFIKDVLSVMNIDIDGLKSGNIDLILSTVELEVEYTAICINPMLTERDSMLISATLDSIKKDKEKNKEEPLNIELQQQTISQFNFNDVQFISNLGKELISVIKDIRFSKEYVLKNKSELIEKSAMLFGKNQKEINDIELAFIKREQLGDTYIKPLMAWLLHCKSPF
ncbi:MAG: BglG family transcription antiterminator, partial [Anaerotignaceae bacterium]